MWEGRSGTGQKYWCVAQRRLGCDRPDKSHMAGRPCLCLAWSQLLPLDSAGEGSATDLPATVQIW